jgi:hypothetical protein
MATFSMPRSSWDTNAAAKRIRVSLYERVASVLLTLLIFLGTAVFLLVMIWWTNKMSVTQMAVPVELAEIGEGEGGGDGRPSGGTQLEDPEPSDAPIVPEPSVAQETDNTMDAMESLVTERVAELDDPNLEPPRPRGDYGSGGGTGGGTGPGRGLGHGPGRPGRPRRWEVRFLQENTLQTYAKQLDFFGIELGVLMPGNKVIYVRNLSSSKPDIRTGPADQEKRYYLTWRGGELRKADLELFAKAGVDPAGHIILKFLPPNTEAKLLQLEKTWAGSRANAVRKTIYAIKPDGDGYAFYVLEQICNQ